MSTVNEQLKNEDRLAFGRLSVDERVALVMRLGDQDLDTFAQQFQPPLTREDARRLVERARQAGRRPSRCMSDLIG